MLIFFEKLFVSLFTTTDVFILLWAGATGFMYYKTLISLKKISDELYIPALRRANRRKVRQYTENKADTKEQEDRIHAQIGKLNEWYSLFSTFVSVFPLLGMLGTVKSLIEVAGKISSETPVMDEFFGALTSTAWGIIFAMIFKAGFDSRVSPKVAAANKEYDLLIERNSLEKL